MKKTSFIINTSRGPIVNEDDLIIALSTNIIAGAGIDVYEKEPLPARTQIKICSKCIIASTYWLCNSRKLFNFSTPK